MNDVEIININVQPSTEVYGYFKNLTYTEGYALAEFIDNSTASYYQHEEELNKKANQDNLQININYDKVADTIKITDDAFGMEIENFKRAVLLGKNTNETGKRNEFGFGLKTAACWFGNIWSVESTEYGSNNLYKITMDIDSLVTDKAPIRSIEKSYCDRDEHYTTITISKLNKKLNTVKIKKEVIDLLNSTYRRDLKSGKVKIMYNGTTLFFNDYEVLNFQNKEWKKPLDFSFDCEGINHHVTGFVAIMKQGGYDKTGFALFKKDRVIVGGYGKNFKPKEIFRQEQSQISLKLFGELNMEDFSTTQAKDDFAWTSELKEAFVTNLKNNISEFISVANLSWKEIKNQDQEFKEEESVSKTDKTEDKEKQNKPSENTSDNLSTESSSKIDDSENIVTKYGEEEKKISDFTPIKISYSGTEYTIDYSDTNKLFEFDGAEKKLTIGKNHNFIKNNVNDLNIISKLVLAFAFAESETANLTDTDGRVPKNLYKMKFDNFLKGLNK